MEDEMMMAEETPEAGEAEMSETQCAEFMEALDEADENPEETEEPEDAEDELLEMVQDQSAGGTQEARKILIGDTEMTPEEIEQIFDRVQSAPERTVVQKLAEQCGMTPEEFMAQADDIFSASRLSAREQQLLAQDYDPGMARHIAQLEVENARYKNRPEEAERMRQKKTEEQIRKNVQEFGAAFPDVYEIPPEVYEDVAKTGATPVVAYQRYLIAERDRELARMKQEQKNRENTPGSVRGRGVEVEDPFLVELMK